MTEKPQGACCSVKRERNASEHLCEQRSAEKGQTWLEAAGGAEAGMDAHPCTEDAGPAVGGGHRSQANKSPTWSVAPPCAGEHAG